MRRGGSGGGRGEGHPTSGDKGVCYITVPFNPSFVAFNLDLSKAKVLRSGPVMTGRVELDGWMVWDRRKETGRGARGWVGWWETGRKSEVLPGGGGDNIAAIQRSGQLYTVQSGGARKPVGLHITWGEGGLRKRERMKWRTLKRNTWDQKYH